MLRKARVDPPESRMEIIQLPTSVGAHSPGLAVPLSILFLVPGHFLGHSLVSTARADVLAFVGLCDMFPSIQLSL